MSVYQGSRYSLSDIITRNDGNRVISLRKKVNFDKKQLTYYTVKQGDTIDGIAYNQYGNAQLYWAIMDCNNYQSELEIKAGDIIAIPPYSEVVKHCV